MATNGTGHERTALVLYGTETGTSQDLAEEIGRLLERLRFATNVGELDTFVVTDLCQYSLTVFIVSTTGQGEFPSNARKFWTGLLRKRLTSTFLGGVQYALVGLGDSSYPKFNWAGRKLEKRLKQLGANEVVDACEADEQGDEGTDGAFLSWIEHFRSRVLSRFELPSGVCPIPDNEQLPSKWLLRPHDQTPERLQSGHTIAHRTDAAAERIDEDTRLIPGSLEAALESNTRVTPSGHWQDVRLLNLHVAEHINYLPGDVLAIVPKNAATDVEVILGQMGWSEVADLGLEFSAASPAINVSRNRAPPVPQLAGQTNVTLRGLLMDYLDIRAIPRRSFFAAIAAYTNNDMHKERLMEFTKTEFLDEYYDYATRPRRSILEILQEFDSVKIPWQEVANVFPALRARQFSIASGGTLKHNGSGTTFELLIAIVKYRTVIKRIREGVCTRYLSGLAAGSTLRVCLKSEGRFHENHMQMPADHLLIGPGTGVAPLRALIQEKRLLSAKEQKDNHSLLVYGGRNADADYFFAEEWKIGADRENNSHTAGLDVVTAFSRDQKTKVYVQNRLRELSENVWDLLVSRNATVIICGSSGQMPKAVREALVDVLTRKNPAPGSVSWTRDEAAAFLNSMEKQGRYKQETW